MSYPETRHTSSEKILLGTYLLIQVLLLLILIGIGLFDLTTLYSISSLILFFVLLVGIVVGSIVQLSKSSKRLPAKVQGENEKLIKVQKKLEKANRKLIEIGKQKDEFISMVAHELRSPLTAVKGYVSMILEGDAGEITDKARGYLSDTNAVTERLIRLVNNMLNVSRIEEGRLVYQMEKVDFIKTAQEVYYTFEFESKRKGVKFSFSVPNGTKDDIHADPDRIREIIGNLVSNAIKFTEKGSVEMKISNPSSTKIKLEVIDTGPGISAEEQRKIFRKFYRASSTEGKTIGTGLGLYISKLLVEKFKGKIGLNAVYGKGSTFWFELPLMGDRKKNTKQKK